MPLTPADVHNVVFSRPRIGKRGYSEQEVDRLLELVEEQLVRHIAEKNELRKLNAELLKRDAAVQKKDAELREWETRLRQWESELRDRDADQPRTETARTLQAAAPRLAPVDLLPSGPAHQEQDALSHEDGSAQQNGSALENAANETNDDAERNGRPLHNGSVQHNVTAEQDLGSTNDGVQQDGDDDAAIHHNGTVHHNGTAQTNGSVHYNGTAQTNGTYNGEVVNGTVPHIVHAQADQQRAAASESKPVQPNGTANGVQGKQESGPAAFRTVADLLGNAMAEAAQQQRMRKAATDRGGSGVTSTESAAQLRQLQLENAELNRINSILKATAALFATQIQRP